MVAIRIWAALLALNLVAGGVLLGVPGVALGVGLVNIGGPPDNTPPVNAPPGDAPPVNAPPDDAPPVNQPPSDAPPVNAPPVDSPPDNS